VARDQVEHADDAEGLPEALAHGNYHPWAAVGSPGNLVIVGWAGSGRGPRLPSLAWLLRTAKEGNNVEIVDATMRGYREHVQLTDEELDRLPGALNITARFCDEFAGRAPSSSAWRTHR
jgi:Ser/Thr protein kinase RdoA (MazF antagonist)